MNIIERKFGVKTDNLYLLELCRYYHEDVYDDEYRISEDLAKVADAYCGWPVSVFNGWVTKVTLVPFETRKFIIAKEKEDYFGDKYYKDIFNNVKYKDSGDTIRNIDGEVVANKKARIGIGKKRVKVHELIRLNYNYSSEHNVKSKID